MTLKEIADNVGVSVSTVSRVINGNNTKCASQKVRDRIWEVANILGYEPNQTAQNLRKSKADRLKQPFNKSNKSFACIFGRSTDINSDPFFTALYRAVEQESYKRGYFIKFSLSFNQLFSNYSEKLFKQTKIDGIIVMGRCRNEYIDYISNKFSNVVYVGLNEIDYDIDQILCDGYEATSKVVHYLYEKGHRKIGFIGETQKEIRYQAFCDTMDELGLEINDEHVAVEKLSMEGGYNGFKQLMQSRELPTAVFCCNDTTAIGTIRAIKEAKLKIPNDISVISIDNIEMSKYVEPMLTTVDIPKVEMGRIAASILCSRVDKQHKLPVKLYFPTRIIERESCWNNIK